jgi:hypothetical protein
MRARRALTGAAVGALLALGGTAVAPAQAAQSQETAQAGTAAAASGCRDAERSITGARVTGYFCWDDDEVWFGVNTDAYLTDTAKDGRRAELWSRDPWRGTVLQSDVTGGAGSQVSLAGYGWYVLTGSPSSTELRVCTSDAGADRRCGSWY